MFLNSPRFAAFALGALGLTCALAVAGKARFGQPAKADKAPAEPAYVARKKGALTFAKDIAPIVYRQCASCHHAGEVAPFSLTSYQDVRKRAAQIAAVCESKFMPPWKAESHGEFIGERKLSAEQIGMIKQWADEGAKCGPVSAVPAAPKFDAGWALGKPDEVVDPGGSYAVGPEGADIYRCFVIPTHYSEDRYLSAIDVHPGNRAIVHHVIAFLDTSGAARRFAAASDGLGYTSFGGPGFPPTDWLGAWVPGQSPKRLPDGIGVEIPKGGDIVLQVHYHKDGKPETDRTQLALYFSKKPVDKRAHVSAVFAPVGIPAGEANYRTHGRYPVPTDITILAVGPHMHLLGKTMKMTANLPDGSEKPLINVTDYDFNWQGNYAYKEPVKIPAGTTLAMSASFDNSESNPRNPSRPPKRVGFGEETTDEMCFGFFTYVIDKEELTKGVREEGFGLMGSGRHGGGGRGGVISRLFHVLTQ